MKNASFGLIAVILGLSISAFADDTICGPYRVQFRDTDNNLELVFPNGGFEELVQHKSSDIYETIDGRFIFTISNKSVGNVVHTTSTLRADGKLIDCD